MRKQQQHEFLLNPSPLRLGPASRGGVVLGAPRAGRRDAVFRELRSGAIRDGVILSIG
jgi:hypothetical protein